MSEKIIVPTLGESVTEATVAKWLKNKGDKVSSDEPLVELETDKVNVEVPSPSNGILDNISAKEGDKVVLCVVNLSAAGISMFATLSCNQKSSNFPAIDLVAARADFLFLVFRQITILEVLYCSLRSLGTCLVK